MFKTLLRRSKHARSRLVALVARAAAGIPLFVGSMFSIAEGSLARSPPPLSAACACALRRVALEGRGGAVQSVHAVCSTACTDASVRADLEGRPGVAEAGSSASRASCVATVASAGAWACATFEVAAF